ncbi:hypothetical protein Daura_01265 [Dactylosporangium aurantiacum]|uniref:Glycosyltransferase RgtA/B/C/D-like domain-containing protein n=1 Tax=Dactylosporangium aurantiacum TaxID=35754 RepID=A0A9Q9IG81_9ACTN|nr:hypothetical protein [Dactylosporangium aurantiacum]MDG6101006.1 hypothetical protein [Dactylosporangium aurantiacum]UWZ54951.1 hypothetical protein Daura_01265 [Dactylosporangium aurantiacum]
MMPTARTLLALLPLAALVFTVFALRPGSLDVRQAVIRAVALVAGVTVVFVELLSLAGWITTWPVVVYWLLFAGGSAFFARRHLRLPSPPVLGGWDKVLLGAIGLLALAELVLALASSPNNFDSNHYHLTKIEHWIADGDLDPYPTVQNQQIILVPGAEYLLLQARLLTGDDSLFNLLQWGAALLAGLAISRCAAQLGAGRTGQLIAAAVFLTAPAVALESTSTQNDLVVTAWVVCAATLALDGAHRLATAADVLSLAAVAGLTAVTKSTGLMALAPVLVFWGVCQLRQRRLLRTAGAALAVVAGLVVLAGPALLRVNDAFGSPLGPPGYSAALSTERKDPPAVLVNGLRLAASTLTTPIPAVNDVVSDAVIAVADLVDVNPNDPKITQWRSVFPGTRWKPDEDRSPYPVTAAVILAALAAALVWRRLPPLVRAYAVTTLGAFILTAAVIKWQDWGNRLILPAFAVGAPLVGYWADRLRSHRAGAVAMVAVLAAAFASGGVSVVYGQPRRLIGQASVFTLTDWQERFVRLPEQAVPYQRAIDDIRASGVRRVGLVMDGDLWEYQFQISLPDVELVAVESVIPTAPPAPVSSVQAIICAATVERCTGVVLPTWRVQRYSAVVAVAFPP